MQAINFVIRSSVGGFQSGVVSGEAGSSTVFLQENEQISLHLARHQISGYERAESDLVITLVDGREITLSGYFGADGDAANRLFISSEGAITELTLVEGGENSYFAQYGTSESWGKWAPDQQLVFYEEAAPLSVADSAVATAYEEETVSMLGAGAILAPMISGGGGGAALAAGGVVAGAAILGGGGDGGGGTTEPKPQEPAKAPATVVDTDVTIGGDNTTEKDETVTITGTGEPGAQVEVEVNGKTETATVDPDGNWSTTFTGPTYPGEGNHTVTVTVTDPDGQVTELAGPDITIDTTPPELDFTAGVVSTSNLHNQTGHNSGTSIGGKGEPGASVAVTIEGVTHTTTVDGSGDWSVTFDKSELEGGTCTAPNLCAIFQ